MATRTPTLQPRSQRHRDWGNYATAADLPNASGAPLAAGDFVLEVGDTAYVSADTQRYHCTAVGTVGGGDAVWASGGGGGGATDAFRTGPSALRQLLPVGAGTNALSAIGLSALGGSGASGRTFNPASAVYLERQLRFGFTTSTVANSTASQRGSRQFAKGESPRMKFTVGFGGSAIGTGRYLVCVADTASQYWSGATEPSSLALELVGIALDSGDANVQVIHNDGAGACTKIDLGAAFARAANMVLEVELTFTSGGGITYAITRLDTGATASGTIATDMPADTAGLAFGYECSTDATGTVRALLDFLGFIMTDGT
jgi:hypothetical protein